MENPATLLTEQRNPSSTHLDEMSSLEIATLMNQEDLHVVEAVHETLPELSKAMELFAKVYQKGGKIIYMGAGSSGRYGVLDMVELLPTFGANPSQFQGLLAGGEGAMFRAKENSEDSLAFAEEDITSAGLKEGDLLIGIAASGSTPYVRRGLELAKQKKAHTISISCVEKDALSQYADIPIHLLCGPEVLTGSTRLKAGTAEKMALNIISTGAMVLSGKVYSNLMVDLLPNNAKLEKRAVRIVMEATGCPKEEAEIALSKCHQHPKVAIIMILKGCDAKQAEAALAKANGYVRKAI